jgi:SNF2 family DNA or RNA helicase
MVRRKKADVLKELPPLRRTTIPLEIANEAEYRRAEDATEDYIYEMARKDPEIMAEIQKYLTVHPELRDEFEELVDKAALHKRASASRALHLVRIAVLRKLAATGKMPFILEWVKDFIESDSKLIIFAVNISIQKMLVNAFPDCVHIMGSDNAEARQRAVDRFQTDPGVRLIVCSMAAASEGITLTAASDVAFVQYGWTPAEHEQAEARAHRIGQVAQAVTAWYLTAQDTIEEDMYQLIERKKKVVTKAADGNRETELDFATYLRAMRDSATLGLE